jgi:hypothetical protein
MHMNTQGRIIRVARSATAMLAISRFVEVRIERLRRTALSNKTLPTIPRNTTMIDAVVLAPISQSAFRIHISLGKEKLA